MFELHSVLSQTKEYSLDFMTVDEQEHEEVVRRRISLQFEAEKYDDAKKVLRDLADSDYRCLLDSLSISLAGIARGPFSIDWYVSEEDDYRISASLIFFEYKE